MKKLERFARKYKVEDGGMSRGPNIYVLGFWRRSRWTLLERGLGTVVSKQLARSRLLILMEYRPGVGMLEAVYRMVRCVAADWMISRVLLLTREIGR